MADKHRCRINASSDSVVARNLKRYSIDPIVEDGWADAILRPSTRVGMTRASGPRPLRRFGNLAVCRSKRFPARRTVLERTSSSSTARGETSPPYSFTSRSNEKAPPVRARDLGRFCRFRNRRSSSHPRTTRSEGVRVVELGSKHPAGWFSIRLISFRGKPVSAAIFE